VQKSDREINVKGSVMNGHEMQDEKAIAHEMFVQQDMLRHSEALSGPPLSTAATIKATQDGVLEPAARNGFWARPEISMLSGGRVDVTKLITVLRQLEGIAKRQCPRIAFKSNGKILFLELAEIVAVQAEGNYVLLQHRPNTYLLRESLSSIAEKLKPYGFIRIHRSVVVNVSAVEHIQPLPTGEYSLHVKGGKEYLVTRTYKDNLRDLAQLWVGSDRFCS
jgi:DNA-binding LytR/AlgR family response regulator